MIGAKRSTPLLLLAAWALMGTLAPAPSNAQPGAPPDGVLRRFQQGTTEPPLADIPVVPRAGDSAQPVAPAAVLATPVVSIDVNVPASGSAGQDLEYRIVVTNRSNAAAHHVEIKDRLPPTARFVKATPEPTKSGPTKEGFAEYFWEVGTMQGGTQKEITFVVKPTGEADVENSAYVVFQHGQKVRTALSRPQLRVREVGPTQAVLNETLKYTLEVTNVGSADATRVLLTDTLPDGLAEAEKGDPILRRDLGTIAPGQTRRFEYTAVAAKNGTWTTQVRASADGLPPVDTSTNVTVGEPKVTVLTSGPSHRLVNRAATYQITVANPGTVPLTGVKLLNKIPAGADITFINGTGGGQFVAAAGGPRNGGQVQWDLGAIPVGGRKAVQMTIRSGTAGKLTNVAEVRADHNQQARDAVLTTFETPEAVTLEIEKSVDPVDAGAEAVYTVRILNPTGRDAANVGLTITVPDELKILDSRGPTQGTTAKQTIAFGKLPALAPGQETAYSVRVQALNAGAGRLRAELTSDALAAPVAQEEAVTIVQPK